MVWYGVFFSCLKIKIQVLRNRILGSRRMMEPQWKSPTTLWWEGQSHGNHVSIFLRGIKCLNIGQRWCRHEGRAGKKSTARPRPLDALRNPRLTFVHMSRFLISFIFQHFSEFFLSSRLDSMGTPDPNSVIWGLGIGGIEVFSALLRLGDRTFSGISYHP